jgi:hypothetical protein
MKKTLALVATVLVCAANARLAAANEIGFYIGAQLGMATKDAPRDFYEVFSDDVQFFFFFTPTEESNSFDDSDLAYSLYVGYQLNTYLAFEGGYSHLGAVTHKSRASGTFPLDSGTMNVNFENETSGFTVSALGTLPLSRDWEVFARAGALFATNKLKLVIAAEGEVFIPPGGNSFVGSFSKGTTDFYAGVGISRRIFEIYDLRLEYQRVFDQGHVETGGPADLDSALLGLTVTF